MQIEMPERRTGLNFYITHINATGNEEKYLLTANYHPKTGQLLEVFCANPMTGSDMEAILTDGCILISLCLQWGVPLERIADILSERRPERGTKGPAASPIGAIAKGLLKLDKELRDETKEKKA